MIEMTTDQQAYRYSEFSRYPLPPFPSQMDVPMDRYNRYMLPHPETGRPTSYTRATTVSSTTSDHYTLNRWKQRMVASNVLKLVDISTGRIEHPGIHSSEAADHVAELYRLIEKDPGEGGLGKYLDTIDNLLGGADAKELGGAVHDWIAELDMGRVLLHQIPAPFQFYAARYQDALAKEGLIAVGEYTERVVLNDRGTEAVAGRIDGVALNVETGKLHILDRKTSKTLDFSALEFGIQIGGVYGWATRMLNQEGTGWDPMPEIDNEVAYIAHIPSDAPEKAKIQKIAMWPGGESMITALKVREERRGAKATFYGGVRSAKPSERSLRYVEARQALQSMSESDEFGNIAEAFGDVWDESLEEFGARCYELAQK